MRVKISNIIHSNQKQSYIGVAATIPDNAIDCSTGYNPYGAPKSAIYAMRNIDMDMLSNYPQGFVLQDAIIDYWKPYANIAYDNILLTDGSMAAIYLVNSAFSNPRAAFLSFSPQFPDYSAHAKFKRIAYRPVFLDKIENYSIDASKTKAEFLAAITKDLHLIYLDNPNNPTGQALSLDFLKDVSKKAQAYGICVLVDEAYGDYMPDAQSAISLLDEFDNVIVLRSFSKGWGLAGMRAGFMLASKEICADLNKVHNPYAASQPSRLAAAAALGERSFLKECCEQFELSKENVRQLLGSKLKMAHTLNTCPICLLYHMDEEYPLMQELLKRKVYTFCGTNFELLGSNSVRLRLPHIDDCPILYDAIHDIGK